MSLQDPPPEIPPPGVPRWPGRPVPQPPAPPAPAVPPVGWPDDGQADDLRARLRRDRRLLLSGPLDEAIGTRTCAELMLLDGGSSRPVELLISSDGGEVEHAMGVLDVLALMRAPVATRCIGSATGTAAAVLASGTGGRSATRAARISLRVPSHHDVRGTAQDMVRLAEHLAAVYDHLAEHLASVTQLSAVAARAALDDGQLLSAQEAVDAGLIDEIAGA